MTTLAHFRRLTPYRVLGGTIVASLLAHLLILALPGPLVSEPEPLPMLTATITEMPPPALVVKPAPRKHPPKPATMTPVLAAAATSEVAVPAPVSAPDATPVAISEAPTLAEEASPTLAEAAPPAPPVVPTLPPRIELVYRGFLGTQGFFIGDAVYRLEHTDSQYTITTVAQARGLAALFLRGEGRLSSTGTITREGLQPSLYTAERTSDGRHEVATFDWETGVVLLNDHKTAALEVPTLDPLAVLWQFYFAPPEQDEAQFNVVTTRRVYHSRFRKVGAESVQLGFGQVETQVWERIEGDGNLTARVWLAPSLHHVMVKMRLSNGRITGEALLDSIRVDDTVAQR